LPGRLVGYAALCWAASSGRLCAQAPDAASAQAAPIDGAAVAAAVDASSAEYRSLVERALEEYALGNWAEAYGFFVRAHALEPNARTERGMGACAFALKQYVLAVQHLRRALADARKPLDAEQRGEATSIVARAEAFVARLQLVLEPSDARVEVDSRAPTFDETGKLLLDRGMHQISAARDGYVPERRGVEVHPGDLLRLELRLARLAPSAPAAPTAAAARATPHSPPTAARLRPWVWTFAIASGVLGGTGVILHVVGNAGVAAVKSACPPQACSEQEIERRIDAEQLETLQLGSAGAFVLAGVSAATAVVLFVVDDAGRHEPSAVSLGLGPTGLRVAGGF
jgi:hypothetical protein